MSGFDIFCPDLLYFVRICAICPDLRNLSEMAHHRWTGFWLSMALDLAHMVLAVQKNLKPSQFYMLNNPCFNNFPKKLIPGNVRAQVLQEPVGASHVDQGRKSGMPNLFSDPGGQAGSNGTPYGQSCLASNRAPGGGSLFQL